MQSLPALLESAGNSCLWGSALLKRAVVSRGIGLAKESTREGPGGFALTGASVRLVPPGRCAEGQKDRLCLLTS